MSASAARAPIVETVMIDFFIFAFPLMARAAVDGLFFVSAPQRASNRQCGIPGQKGSSALGVVVAPALDLQDFPGFSRTPGRRFIGRNTLPCGADNALE